MYDAERRTSQFSVSVFGSLTALELWSKFTTGPVTISSEERAGVPCRWRKHCCSVTKRNFAPWREPFIGVYLRRLPLPFHSRLSCAPRLYPPTAKARTHTKCVPTLRSPSNWHIDDRVMVQANGHSCVRGHRRGWTRCPRTEFAAVAWQNPYSPCIQLRSQRHTRDLPLSTRCCRRIGSSTCGPNARDLSRARSRRYWRDIDRGRRNHAVYAGAIDNSIAFFFYFIDCLSFFSIRESL